jgi:hypothetical protein
MMTPQTTTPEQLLRRYQEGRITAKGLILIVLSVTDRLRLMKILDALPADILEQLKDFVDNYEPGMKIFHGPRPRIRAVRSVSEWFGCGGRTVPARRLAPSSKSLQDGCERPGDL